jgi:uncharacterized protein (DUF2249 family)
MHEAAGLQGPAPGHDGQVPLIACPRDPYDVAPVDLGRVDCARARISLSRILQNPENSAQCGEPGRYVSPRTGEAEPRVPEGQQEQIVSDMPRAPFFRRRAADLPERTDIEPMAHGDEALRVAVGTLSNALTEAPASRCQMERSASAPSEVRHRARRARALLTFTRVQRRMMRGAPGMASSALARNDPGVLVRSDPVGAEDEPGSLARGRRTASRDAESREPGQSREPGSREPGRYVSSRTGEAEPRVQNGQQEQIVSDMPRAHFFRRRAADLAARTDIEPMAHGDEALRVAVGTLSNALTEAPARP